MDANDKFQELMKLMNDLGISQPPSEEVSEDVGLPEMFEELIKAGSPPDISMTKKALTYPDGMQKVNQANAQAMVVMPSATPEKWLVQVFPEEENSLHFQAKSPSAGEGIYLRWYVKVPAEQYEVIQAIWAASQPHERRMSLYGSGKPYLICKRLDKDTIEIPNFGPFDLGEMFNPS